MLRDGTVFALRGGAMQPLQPAIFSAGRWQAPAPQALPASFPQSALVTPASVTFPSRDGPLSHGQLFVPRNAGTANRHPAVLFFHGVQFFKATALYFDEHLASGATARAQRR